MVDNITLLAFTERTRRSRSFGATNSGGYGVGSGYGGGAYGTGAGAYGANPDPYSTGVHNTRAYGANLDPYGTGAYGASGQQSSYHSSAFDPPPMHRRPTAESSDELDPFVGGTGTSFHTTRPTFGPGDPYPGEFGGDRPTTGPGEPYPGASGKGREKGKKKKP